MTLTQSEQEELRVAIATEMGWKLKECGYHGCKTWHSPLGICADGDDPCCISAPYTTSIDAIREAAMERFKTKAERNEFEYCLGDNTTIGTYSIWQLTALDWCIAFARTAKIWRCKV